MMLPCPLYQITGFQCPFCGLQRGVLALLHGHLAEAWAMNPMLWVTLPYLLLLAAGGMNIGNVRKWRIYDWAKKDSTLLGYAVLMMVWGIVRNLI